MHNVIDTVIQIDALGLVTHPEKSVFNPNQQLVILGFVLNSVNMTITLTLEKALTLQTACSSLHNTASLTIREVARVFGMLVSSFPGVMYGAVHYRHIAYGKLAHCETTDGTLTDACLYRQMLNWSLSGG